MEQEHIECGNHGKHGNHGDDRSPVKAALKAYSMYFAAVACIVLSWTYADGILHGGDGVVRLALNYYGEMYAEAVIVFASTAVVAAWIATEVKAKLTEDRR